ncbi:hypothetical protein [Prolixibacter sp. SD074]|jgi:hypothetical protein|uniref:hypothetical protein n=1 Tax=Prolixibacter sp. SD074 TaxID=2652391 RepID=UPI00126AF0CB|nr:hypothetical protein [Prolixibacter sp. SD074]GET29908.1 hypothetical protein SD074_21100 [Prolixibacter sp. SD074]
MKTKILELSKVECKMVNGGGSRFAKLIGYVAHWTLDQLVYHAETDAKYQSMPY